MRKILASVWHGSQGRVVVPSEPPDEAQELAGEQGSSCELFFFSHLKCWCKILARKWSQRWRSLVILTEALSVER